MLQENVFRFLSVRPGDQRKKIEREPKTIPVYEAATVTEFGTSLKQLHDANASRAAILRLVRAYQASDAYVKTLDGLPLDVNKALRWMAERSGTLVKKINFNQALNSLYDQTAKKLVTTEAFKTTRARLSDTLVAEALFPNWARPTDGLAAARKWLGVIEKLARDESLDDDVTLGVAMTQLRLSIPDFARFTVAPPLREPKPEAPRSEEEEEEGDKLRRRLVELENAHRELSRKVVDEEAIVKPEPLVMVNPQLNIQPRLSDFERRLERIETAHLTPGEKEIPARTVPAAGATLSPLGGARIMLKSETIAGFSDTTRRALKEARIDVSRLEPTVSVGLLEEEMNVISAQLASTQAPETVILLGGVMMEAGKVRDSIVAYHHADETPDTTCEFQAGVGDLLMVKQTLKAYELAEFAHVENVLAGEARVREHRRLNVREEIQVEEEERETEKERNLQSTERNEMQSEAEKTVKSQFELDAGLQVSGSYGPSVSFSASLNVGFSTSTEETQRKAVSYSREVTEKTSERVRERVKRELRRRMLEQVEELNRHTITNEPATNGHVRGIYRWLNKLYNAQILNYGQRMMFEFVVPEPAAYLLYALIENPPKDNELVKPLPPTYYGAPLKPSHLTRTNYLDFVANYQVRSVQAPPPEFQHVATFDKQDQTEEASIFGRAIKVDIPAGYRAYAATVMSDYSFLENQTPAFHVMVGGTDYDRTPYWGSEYKGLNSRYKELGVAYHLRNVIGFSAAIDVYCQLTPEGFTKWQQAVYDSIMEAYLVQKAEYDEKLAALAIQQGVKILGRNPLENRRIEREELKKLVVMMLTENTDTALDSINGSPEPVLDLAACCGNGSWIRFFENAFEWNNMMYVLYPYFWGRHARWISALHFTDPDPDFAAFLNAGAARIQVPVRPGFEKAVAYFLQFKQIWEGNDPPLRDDDLYVPIVDEIAENLGKLDDGVPYPEDAEPWEVRIPTSLVLVQNLEEIPGIKDSLTGNDVVITG